MTLENRFASPPLSRGPLGAGGARARPILPDPMPDREEALCRTCVDVEAVAEPSFEDVCAPVDPILGEKIASAHWSTVPFNTRCRVMDARHCCPPHLSYPTHVGHTRPHTCSNHVWSCADSTRLPQLNARQELNEAFGGQPPPANVGVPGVLATWWHMFQKIGRVLDSC